MTLVVGVGEDAPLPDGRTGALRPVAMVTGARRGIGYTIAARLVQAGFDLVVADLSDEIEAVAERLRTGGGSVLALTGDLCDLDTHAAWLAAIRAGPGRVDCLVNNAGMGAIARGDVMDLSSANFDRVMDVNLRGTMFLTLTMLKLMLEQPLGPLPRSIVNITSVSAALVSPDRLEYCVSKAALAMWSKGLAVRFAKDGIGVYDVRPGIIRSDMTAGVTDKYDRLIDAGLVPAGRWGEGADVAEAVATLASGALAFSTGAIIEVDGGLHLGRL